MQKPSIPWADYIPRYIPDEKWKAHQRALSCDGQVSFWQLVSKLNMGIFMEGEKNKTNQQYYQPGTKGKTQNPRVKNARAGINEHISGNSWFRRAALKFIWKHHQAAEGALTKGGSTSHCREWELTLRGQETTQHCSLDKTEVWARAACKGLNILLQ